MRWEALHQRLTTITKRKEELIRNLEKEIAYFNEHEIHHQLLISNSNAESKPSYEKLKELMTDQSFNDKITPMIQNIPESNGSQFFNKTSTKIGMLADEFLYNSYKDVANLVYISRNIDKEKLLNLDLVIISSAWKGIKNDWRGMANPKSKVREELIKLINYLKENGKKVIFYSKEDPTNYEKFVGIAKECNYIFTTALEKVNDYKVDCKNENVGVLEFGVNPILNNPIGININNKFKEAIFAGSWYEKYPERVKDSKILFDGLIASGRGLKIIDRNYHLNLPNHYYPERYLPYISPSVEHLKLQKAFKLFDWVVNLNSVKNSETMFANRIFELQAMGNVILSNYSLGINNKFPNIFMAHTAKEVPLIVNNITREELYEHKMVGVRKVLKEHTTFHRINQLIEQTNINGVVNQVKYVGVVVEKLTEKAIDNFKRQTYEYKELLTTKELNDEKYNKFDYITFFHDSFFYEEYYLEDMINGFKYTNSDYITKHSYLVNGLKKDEVEHNYVNQIYNKYCTVFVKSKFSCDYLLGLNGQVSIPNGYSIDSLELQEGTLRLYYDGSEQPELSIIIPIYNNGEHLLSKCFLSLRRSSIFKKMDIILVDDGSTDEDTIRIINRLERRYKNVQKYCFNDGGSGSASRPRNKGIELAKTDLITFLDPDNEAINDGYAKLLSEIKSNPSLDMVIGNIVKIDKQTKRLNYTYHMSRWNMDGIVEDTYEFLKETKMKAQSIQALIVRKKIIIDNKLKMVERATGQDTLFFQELLLHSNKIKGVNEIIHIYYAAVSNSVTNTISKSFFEKYLILEKERLKFLERNNLLEVYMNERFNFYFTNWYLARIPRIKDRDLITAIDTLAEIYNMYKKFIINEPEEIKVFNKFLKKKQYKEIRDYFNKLT